MLTSVWSPVDSQWRCIYFDAARAGSACSRRNATFNVHYLPITSAVCAQNNAKQLFQGEDLNPRFRINYLKKKKRKNQIQEVLWIIKPNRNKKAVNYFPSHRSSSNMQWKPASTNSKKASTTEKSQGNRGIRSRVARQQTTLLTAKKKNTKGSSSIC